MNLTTPHLKTPNQVTRNSPVALFLCLLALGILALTPRLQAQVDNFDDGDDVGWDRYDRTGTGQFSFPNGGYRMVSVYPGAPTLIISTRTNIYTDWYASVDLLDWDDNTVTNARSAVGLAARAADIGPGTSKALVLYWTPAISGGGNRVFSIYYVWNDTPIAPVAATFLTLETTNDYRMVFSGVGNIVEGKVYNLKDLSRPIAYVRGDLSSPYVSLPDLPASGRCGVILTTRNNTTVSVTYDNYFAAAADPGGVPAPGIPHPVPGTPQVVNRVPVSDKNFHPWASGISFNATTLGGNPLSAIQMWLNGVEVSSSLVLGGSPNNRTVNFNGLTSNRLYHAVIRLAESGGKSSTNEFWFDTFSEHYVTNVARMVEVEDYNYDNGMYINDPPPSGYRRSDGQPVNYGIGYVDRVGSRTVDFLDQRTAPEAGFNAYRFSDAVGTYAGIPYYQTDAGFTMVNTNDTPLGKFEALDLPDYHVRQTRRGEWLNYTRDYAAGRYHVYLRLSCQDAMPVWFDEVTGDRTQPNQTTARLGRFNTRNTGHMSILRYFQLADGSGNPVVLNWSGTKTFRLTLEDGSWDGDDAIRGSLHMNYLMFVPAPPSPVTLINPTRVGNVFSVSFASESGVTYTLQYKNALTDPTWTNGASLAGDGTVKTLSDTSTQSARFYRVVAN